MKITSEYGTPPITDLEEAIRETGAFVDFCGDLNILCGESIVSLARDIGSYVRPASLRELLDVGDISRAVRRGESFTLTF